MADKGLIIPFVFSQPYADTLDCISLILNYPEGVQVCVNDICKTPD